AGVPAPLVASAVHAASLSAAGKAVAGAVSARAAALAQGVLHALFTSKVKTIALVLLAVSVLGSGAGLLARHSPGVRAGTTGIATPPRTPVRGAEEAPDRAGRERADEGPPFAAEDDPPAPPEPGGTGDLLHFSGTVMRVDEDGLGIGLKTNSKADGESPRREVRITDRTRLVFSNVGPDEARPTEGYRAEVWTETDGRNAARVHLSGNRLARKDVSPAYPVVAAAADGRSVILEKPVKGAAAAEKIIVRFTDTTRIAFANVAR